MESFVPTEYDNVYMDYEGFIYACTTNVSEHDLDNGTADPVRRLNLMGNDILVRNGDYYIIGDLYWGSGGGYEGPSLFTDVTAMDNDVFSAWIRQEAESSAMMTKEECYTASVETVIWMDISSSPLHLNIWGMICWCLIHWITV